MAEAVTIMEKKERVLSGRTALSGTHIIKLSNFILNSKFF